MEWTLSYGAVQMSIYMNSVTISVIVEIPNPPMSLSFLAKLADKAKQYIFHHHNFVNIHQCSVRFNNNFDKRNVFEFCR